MPSLVRCYTKSSLRSKPCVSKIELRFIFLSPQMPMIESFYLVVCILYNEKGYLCLNIIWDIGDNGGPMRWRSYINGVAVLNTDFTWTTPSNQGIPPSRRSYASAAILDGAHLTVAFGNKCCLIMRFKTLTKILYFYLLHVQNRIIAQYLVQRYQCARSG